MDKGFRFLKNFYRLPIQILDLNILDHKGKGLGLNLLGNPNDQESHPFLR